MPKRLGNLRCWTCQACGARHHGFKNDICLNERCPAKNRSRQQKKATEKKSEAAGSECRQFTLF